MSLCRAGEEGRLNQPEVDVPTKYATILILQAAKDLASYKVDSFVSSLQESATNAAAAVQRRLWPSTLQFASQRAAAAGAARERAAAKAEEQRRAVAAAAEAERDAAAEASQTAEAEAAAAAAAAQQGAADARRAEEDL
jgi:hypothetical protein